MTLGTAFHVLTGEAIHHFLVKMCSICSSARCTAKRMNAVSGIPKAAAAAGIWSKVASSKATSLLHVRPFPPFAGCNLIIKTILNAHDPCHEFVSAILTSMLHEIRESFPLPPCSVLTALDAPVVNQMLPELTKPIPI
jgi:hypothetical protein